MSCFLREISFLSLFIFIPHVLWTFLYLSIHYQPCRNQTLVTKCVCYCKYPCLWNGQSYWLIHALGRHGLINQSEYSMVFFITKLPRNLGFLMPNLEHTENLENRTKGYQTYHFAFSLNVSSWNTYCYLLSYLQSLHRIQE